MKKIMIAMIAMMFLMAGCGSMMGTYVVPPTSYPRPDRPALDLRFGLYNDSDRWVQVQGLGFKTVILGPHQEAHLVSNRLGTYKGIAHAYRSVSRKRDGSVSLHGYMDSKKFTIRLTGRTRSYRGRVVGDYQRFSGFYYKGGTRFPEEYKFGPINFRFRN